jgi:hypothetical protein
MERTRDRQNAKEAPQGLESLAVTLFRLGDPRTNSYLEAAARNCTRAHRWDQAARLFEMAACGWEADGARASAIQAYIQAARAYRQAGRTSAAAGARCLAGSVRKCPYR